MEEEYEHVTLSLIHTHERVATRAKPTHNKNKHTVGGQLLSSLSLPFFSFYLPLSFSLST